MAWICPHCKKEFKNKNQAHSCARIDLKEHLKNKSPQIKAAFNKLIRELNKFGKITLNPVKTSIQVKTTSTFLSIKPKKDQVEIEFQLGREVNEFPVYKSFRISKNRVLHFAILKDSKDVNFRLRDLLKESYELVSQ